MSTAERFQGYLTALHELPPAERNGPVALLDLSGGDARVSRGFNLQDVAE